MSDLSLTQDEPAHNLHDDRPGLTQPIYYCTVGLLRLL